MKSTLLESATGASRMPRFDSPLSRWIELWQRQLVNGLPARTGYGDC
jgi:hypothetical protein